jgi:hypothetical protein
MVSSISTNGDAEGLKSSILELQDEHHSHLILSSLNMMRKNKHFCDVILHVSYYSQLGLLLDKVWHNLISTIFILFIVTSLTKINFSQAVFIKPNYYNKIYFKYY